MTSLPAVICFYLPPSLSLTMYYTSCKDRKGDSSHVVLTGLSLANIYLKKNTSSWSFILYVETQDAPDIKTKVEEYATEKSFGVIWSTL